MLIFYFYLISFSLIGYGLLVNSILKIRFLNLGFVGILGISIISLISYSTSFFFKHDYNFNLIIISFGVFLFFYFFKIIKKPKNEILILFLILTILIIFILVGKNHDDFPYYHFPYISFLTENPHPVGFGLINNGFRSPSSIFFISSLFYLPGASYYLFHLTPAFILCFSNIILFRFILDKKIFKLDKFLNFLTLISFCFINIFFYRLAEHGTDRSGMILIILSIIILFLIISLNKKDIELTKSFVKIFSIFIFFVLSIKPFYLINLPLFLVLIYYKFTRKVFLNLFLSRSFFYCIFFLIFTVFYTFINSSCLIFPIVQTCFENLEWSINKNTISNVNLWFELWSKSGANPNSVVDDKAGYVSNFNWLQNWIVNYFFNKMLDFLLGLVVLSLVIIFSFYKFINKQKKINFKNYYIIYFILIFFFIEWFFNHPTLRYGGYHIIALIFFIPVCLLLKNSKIDFDNFSKKALVLITITLIIFVSRNVNRLNKEFSNYNYNPLQNPEYKFIGGDEKFFFRYQAYFDKHKKNYLKFNLFGKEKYIITY